MNAAIIFVRMIFLASLLVAILAGLSELEVLGNGRTLGVDSLMVMLWAMALATLTSPILVSFVFPQRSDGELPDEEKVTSSR